MDITDFLPQLAELIGIAPSQLLFYIGFITFLANSIARFIPQDATGWQGQVRRICAIIGVYIPSRVSPGISVTDVAGAVVANKIEDVKKEVLDAASEAPALIPDIIEGHAEDLIEEAAQKVVPAFPGLVGMVFHKEEADEEDIDPAVRDANP